MATEYKKGFDDAIKKVRDLLYCETKNYEKLYIENKFIDLAFKGLALIDFDILVHDLFQ